MLWWVLTGVATGLAMVSKYTAVLVPAGVAATCLAVPKLRPVLRHPGAYVATLCAALVFAPVVAWNARHGWISFAFQLQHGLGGRNGSVIGRELELLGGQLGLVTPILFALMVAAVVAALRRSSSPRRALLAGVAVSIWAFFALSALRHPVAANWPALAILPAAVVLGTDTGWVGRTKWLPVGELLAGAVVLVVYSHAVHPWLPIPAPRDPIAQAYGWEQLAAAVELEASRDSAHGDAAAGERRIWIAADRYQEAAELMFHLPAHPPVLALEMASRPSQFDLWPTAAQVIAPGDDMIVALDATSAPAAHVVEQLTPHFTSVVAGPVVEMRWGTARVVARRRMWQFVNRTLPLSPSHHLPAP
jgi:hypothetical protein